MKPSLIETDLEFGWGIITSVQGDPGPAADISYTVTYVFPDGLFEGVERQAPMIDRWGGDLDVTPLNVNTWFAAGRIDRQFVHAMPRELPVYRPCGGGQIAPLRPAVPMWTGDFLEAFLAAPDTHKRAVANELRRFL